MQPLKTTRQHWTVSSTYSSTQPTRQIAAVRPVQPDYYLPILESSRSAGSTEVKHGSMARGDGRVWQKEKHNLVHLKRGTEASKYGNAIFRCKRLSTVHSNGPTPSSKKQNSCTRGKYCGDKLDFALSQTYDSHLSRIQYLRYTLG